MCTFKYCSLDRCMFINSSTSRIGVSSRRLWILWHLLKELAPIARYVCKISEYTTQCGVLKYCSLDWCMFINSSPSRIEVLLGRLWSLWRLLKELAAIGCGFTQSHNILLNVLLFPCQGGRTSIQRHSVRCKVRLNLQVCVGLRRVLVERLTKVDPSGMTHEQKLAFWINLYNALLMHVSCAWWCMSM